MQNHANCIRSSPPLACCELALLLSSFCLLPEYTYTGTYNAFSMYTHIYLSPTDIQVDILCIGRADREMRGCAQHSLFVATLSPFVSSHRRCLRRQKCFDDCSVTAAFVPLFLAGGGIRREGAGRGSARNRDETSTAIFTSHSRLRCKNASNWHILYFLAFRYFHPVRTNPPQQV